MKHLSEQVRRQRAEGFLGMVKAIKAPSKPKKPSVSELPFQAVSILTKSALEPGTPLLGIYKDLGLHPAEGKGALDTLLAKGMVRTHRMARRGRGGQPVVVEVIERGIEELHKRGITPAPKLIRRGGFKHDVYARWLRTWAQAQRFEHWFEWTLEV